MTTKIKKKKGYNSKYTKNNKTRINNRAIIIVQLRVSCEVLEELFLLVRLQNDHFPKRVHLAVLLLITNTITIPIIYTLYVFFYLLFARIKNFGIHDLHL